MLVVVVILVMDPRLFIFTDQVEKNKADESLVFMICWCLLNMEYSTERIGTTDHGHWTKVKNS